MSIRSIVILLGVALFAAWAGGALGLWTLFITGPLSAYAGWVTGALDLRDNQP